MKKINSIGYAHKILAACGMLVVVLPVAFSLAGRWLGLPFLVLIARVVLGAGLVLCALFALLLFVELRQDAAINRRYQREKYQKLPLGGGRWECQHCGSREVGEGDAHCSVCEIQFRQQ